MFHPCSQQMGEHTQTSLLVNFPHNKNSKHSKIHFFSELYCLGCLIYLNWKCISAEIQNEYIQLTYLFSMVSLVTGGKSDYP